MNPRDVPAFECSGPSTTVDPLASTTTECRIYGATGPAWATEADMAQAIGIPLIVFALMVILVLKAVRR